MGKQAGDFAVGDRIKRIGVDEPIMVIEEIYAEVYKYRYRCSWFGQDGKPKYELFRFEEIESVPDVV